VTLAHLESLDPSVARFADAMRRRRLPYRLRFTRTPEESMAINTIRSGAIVIAASGMCEAGRIRHHLRHNLGREECGILFTGFQAGGTLGRRLVDGARSVRLFGETVPVRARIHTLGGLSAHADRKALLAWLAGFRRPPSSTFVVHGEEAACLAFTAAIEATLGWPVRAPGPGETAEC
jgi:metallo-beta-lactamase family protein